MTIVLNENEWAEEMIKNHSLGKKPYETLCRVAKYYIDNKYSKKETRVLLDTFLLQCDNTASLPQWSDTLDYAVIRALKYDAVKIDSIDITKPEMEIINSLEKVQLRRLAFTLLCLAKYWLIVNPNSNGWVNNKDSEIMKYANINTSIKRQSAMYSELRELGLIQFSKKIDNTNVKVCFIKEGDVAHSVTDFRNLGYQYLLSQGSDNYMQCQSCGVVFRKDNIIPKELPQKGGRPRKYCKECSASNIVRTRVNSVMRHS